jgi:hypothetical protein
MQENSIKYNLLKTIYGVIIFIIAVFVISRLTNDENADMTAQMAAAKLPTVSLVSGTHEINQLHGFLNEMDVSHMHGTVYPVDSDRSVFYRINTFGQSVDSLGFEVRNIDGKGLVENTNLVDYKKEGNIISGSFQLKDLIQSKKEYMLVLFMDTAAGKVRFYNRIVWVEDGSKYHVQEELDFVKGFSAATFDKEAAKEYSRYLESNSEGDNTTFNRVNIHSSLSQVTWGDLDITEHTQPLVFVTDIHSQTGSYKLQYVVSVRDGSVIRKYNVSEAFRVRYTADRMYLLNYERTMDYIFGTKNYSISSNTIGLSISSPEIQILENSNGTAFSFVSENRLFMFNNSENKLAFIFGFYDAANSDLRCTYDHNKIKALQVDEAGNVRFAVAGYMNRGIHEGEVGIAVYEYNAALNSVEENAFIPSRYDPEIIIEYFDTIAYVSNNNVFYVMLDQNIYAIDLTDRTATSVVDNIGAGEYKISESESAIAWQSRDLKSLNLMDLDTTITSVIEAAEGDYIQVLGFMGEDLVYGLVHESDIQDDQMGNPIYAMYNIKIQDRDGNILENYHPEGIYVTSSRIVDNQMRLTRVKKDEETGKFVSHYDDQITSTLKPEKGSNIVGQVSVDVFEKIVQITAKSQINTKQLRVLTPAQTLFEGDRNIEIDSDRNAVEKPFYYVHGLMGIEGIYTDSSQAIQTAFSAPGVVTGDNNKYVWIKGNLLRSNQIMSITRNAESYEDMTSKDSVLVCLDLILQFQGINRNVESMLASGDSVTDILDSALPDAAILDLDGCPLNAMLYFVNQDIPVFAMLNDGTAMLIIGFNDLNTVLMNPQTGTVYKYGMKDSEKLFEENGNHFITYLMEGN